MHIEVTPKSPDAFQRAFDAEIRGRLNQAIRLDQWVLPSLQPPTRRRARRIRVIANRMRRESRQTWARWWAPNRIFEHGTSPETHTIFCTAPGWNGRFNIGLGDSTPIEPEPPRYVRHHVEGE